MTPPDAPRRGLRLPDTPKASEVETLLDAFSAEEPLAVRNRALLELVYGSGSDLLLLPFQDAFGLRDRVNVPGTVTEENWTYRMPRDLGALAADLGARDRLRGLAVRSGRIPRTSGGERG